MYYFHSNLQTIIDYLSYIYIIRGLYASIAPTWNNSAKWLKIGKLISHFWLTKYLIRNALELAKKEIVKHPSLSVNPDSQALDKDGKIAD